MTKEQYRRIEAYMLSCMAGSAHDREHVYRVLYLALDIAETEPEADRDVLIAAALLHDVGRPEQMADQSLDHARVGAEKVEGFLRSCGYGEAFVSHVCECILCHRFRRARPPETIEAKILFDADKLDVCGATGIARTLQYGGSLGCPLYHRDEAGFISDGREGHDGIRDAAGISFFQEYHYKLEKLYDRFLTPRGEELARQRKEAARAFYEALLSEVRSPEETGRALLEGLLG
jgi:uncharacterized protein